jgi:Rho termination factor, N-terminal domain
MASFNDTLTLGLILVLLFGAASLYLYTRVQQCEQKLNLVESILLDIKMSAELQGYPEPPQKEEAAPTKPPSPKTSPFLSVDEEEMYKDAIAEAMDEGAVTIEAEELSSLDQVPASIPTASPKVNTNYESMTLAELKAIAKQRGITGSSSMKRSQLLEALKPKAAPADGGILSALAEQGAPVESN